MNTTNVTTESGFAVSLYIESGARGQPVPVAQLLEINIRVTNEGTQDLTFTQSVPQLDFNFSVLGPDGKPVDRSAAGRQWADMQPAAVKVRQLRRQEQVSYRVQLDKLFLFATSGIYKVKVTRVFGMNPPVSSNELSLEVLEP